VHRELTISLFSDSSMNMNAHVDPPMQARVGLHKPNITLVRDGERNATGDESCTILSSVAYQAGFTQNEALLLWNMIPTATRDAPTDADKAAILSKLAQIARQLTPPACLTLLNGDEERGNPVTYLFTPGSPFIEGRRNAIKLIAFVDANQDRGHRIKWSEMTGRQQFEWYDAYVRSGCVHTRVEAETRGLVGTNCTEIDTTDKLADALPRSPSLARRRPATSPVTADEWANVARELAYWTET